MIDDIDNESNEVPFFESNRFRSFASKNVHVVLHNPNRFKAMKNENDSLVENNVWCLVKSDEKPVGNRWNFASKFWS